MVASNAVRRVSKSAATAGCKREKKLGGVGSVCFVQDMFFIFVSGTNGYNIDSLAARCTYAVTTLSTYISCYSAAVDLLVESNPGTTL